MRVKTDEVFKNLTLNDASAIETIAKEAGYPVKEVKAETTGGNYRIVLEAQTHRNSMILKRPQRRR